MSSEPADLLDHEPSAGGRAIASGAMWNYVAFGASKAAVFVSTVILARLLVPGDFGLLALGLLVLNYLDALRDLGIPSAVVYWRGDERLVSNVGFITSMASSLVLAGALVFAAPLLASFFSEPRLTNVLRALALAFPLTAASAVHEARLKRDLRFRRRIVPELIRAVTKGAVAIALAAAGLGVWSLVWGQLASALAASVAYWVAAPWRPAWMFDRRVARGMLSYGSRIMAVGFLGIVIKDVDYLIIGRSLDSRDLGYYSLAFRLPEMAILSLAYVFSQTVFPIFSRVRDDVGALSAGYLTTLRLLTLVTVPVAVGVVITAPEFVSAFYGSRWAPAVPALRFLALYAAVSTIGFVAGDVYKATGRVTLLVLVNLATLPLNVVVLLIAVRSGIGGVALGQLVVAAVLMLFHLNLARLFVGVSARQIVQSLVPALVAALTTGAAAWGARAATTALADPVRLALETAAGAVAYLLVVGTIFRSSVVPQIAALRSRRSASA